MKVIAKSRTYLLSGFAVANLGLLGYASMVQTPALEATPEQAVFFETKIRPVLWTSCVGCHGPNSQVAGLRLDSREAMIKGGDSGTSLAPGDISKSLLITVIHRTGPIKMPKGGALKPAEIADFETWVAMGAPWPKGGTKSVVAKPPLWSLQPIKIVKPPVAKVVGWAKNPIDGFIQARLAQESLTPNKSPDKQTLLRRISYDLTGLPPTMEEISEFQADKSEIGFEHAVDRMLAKPQYGERWARLWLDVARYADTKGYVFEEDRNYPNAYTYRDWLINAFNSDLPYDQFIKQQLAADLLPEVKNSDDKRPLAAMGFLTLGRRFLNQAPDIIDDRIDVTMRGMQGLTVACARCHDHKFDPVPTQDYYSLYAVFDSSNEESAPISAKPIRDPWIKYSQQLTSFEQQSKELILDQINKLRTSTTVKGEAKAALQGLREDQFPSDDQLKKILPAFVPSESTKLMGYRTEMQRLKASAPPSPEFAMAMTESPQPHDGVIFKRGNPGNPGGPAPRRFLAALSAPGSERASWKTGSGRLELAESIASKKNPLTARVIVNRIWQGHFGNGLVRTASDFGYHGEKPTHPELLDYLASRFMEEGWSLKKLHKLILMSATYQQSSDASAAKVMKDPDNRLLSHFPRRRLDLEQMRDSVLSVAGKLNLRSTGGKSVDIWSAPFTNRRSLYGFVDRQNLPGVFRTFDFASPDSTNARRFITTVPQQALFFLNSPFTVENARSLTQRNEIKSAGDEGQRIRRIYQVILGRLPDAQEFKAGVAFIQAPENGDRRLQNWEYGYGSESEFHPMPSFIDGSYQGGPKIPDPKFGYLLIQAEALHPGPSQSLAAIRRWTSPFDGQITVMGSINHTSKEGDGVRGRIISSKAGKLGEWSVLAAQAQTLLPTFKVNKGETLDFILDCQANDGYDACTWPVKITNTVNSKTWFSVSDFGPPPPPALDRLALYAQALMMSNEFIFVD